MESIKRKLLILKPDANGKGRATLKLMSQKDGINADLSAEELPDGLCALYLWDRKGKEYCAGSIANGRLNVNLCLPVLDEVAGAAVVNEQSGVFLLKSSNFNWDAAATAFRLSRLQTSKTADTEKLADKLFDNNEYEKVQYDNFQEKPIISESKTDFNRGNNSSQSVCGSCPHVIRQDKINPFPSVFPQSEWVKISYPGPAGWWHYISGKILRGDKVIAKVLGVPGEYGMAPPIWLEGFGTYMRCALPDAHGYWLMFQDAQTGEVLDMALSPRDE